MRPAEACDIFLKITIYFECQKKTRHTQIHVVPVFKKVFSERIIFVLKARKLSANKLWHRWYWSLLFSFSELKGYFPCFLSSRKVINNVSEWVNEWVNEKILRHLKPDKAFIDKHISRPLKGCWLMCTLYKKKVHHSQLGFNGGLASSVPKQNIIFSNSLHVVFSFFILWTSFFNFPHLLWGPNMAIFFHTVGIGTSLGYLSHFIRLQH